MSKNSMFVGRTMIKRADVRSQYRDIAHHYVSDIEAGCVNDAEKDGRVIFLEDYYDVVDKIRAEIEEAVAELENLNTKDAIDILEVLEEKLSY